MNKVAVIMAGGKGERFWPKSRSALPKQFLSLTADGVTMIQHTVQRLLSFVAPEDIYIVTNRAYGALAKEQLPQLPEKNILEEPCAKNTAPCIALATAAALGKYDDALMMILPSDHLIKNNEMFLDTLENACKVAEAGENLVTIGITPSYPETGYGYIKFAHKAEKNAFSGAYPVERFVEKPDLATAKQYLLSGDYLWNSGMFVWRAKTILGCFEEYIPSLYEGVLQMREAFKKGDVNQVVASCFAGFSSVSIDYGVMEKAKNIFTLPGSFGWDDVGSWLALERFHPTTDQGNTVSGDILTINTKNSVIVGGDRLIALVGVEDLVVVDSGDALLICARDTTQDIKKVVENLRICNRNDLI